MWNGRGSPGITRRVTEGVAGISHEITGSEQHATIIQDQDSCLPRIKQ